VSPDPSATEGAAAPEDVDVVAALAARLTGGGEGEAAAAPKKKRKKKKAVEEASGSMMRPSTSAMMRVVDQHYARRLWGEPDGSMVFDGGKVDYGVPVPRMIDVPYWTWAEGALLAVNDASTRERPASGRSRGLTRLATVGMSDAPQVDGSRIELHMAIARDLGEDERLRTELTVFLASVAAYPYQYQDALTRDCFLPNTGEIPGWPGFPALLLDEPGVEPGDDAIPLPTGESITLHLLVPVLPHELDLLRAQGAAALRRRWRESWTDRFDPDRIGR